MFFVSGDVDAKILSVIEMSWQRVNARAGARPFHTLSYRLVGGATFFADGKEILRAEEDEIVFVPENYDFSKQAGKGRIIAIHFLSDSPLPDTIQRFSPKNAPQLRQEFQELLAVWHSRRTGFEYEAKILLYRILLEMERQWSAGSPGDPRLDSALAYIHAHLSDSALSVDSLAKSCSMSDTYFRKLFVQALGMTPQQYISALRLDMATELLRSGYYSVGEIAERCGFNNANYFSLFIKKQTGISPLQYRKKLLRK